MSTNIVCTSFRLLLLVSMLVVATTFLQVVSEDPEDWAAKEDWVAKEEEVLEDWEAKEEVHQIHQGLADTSLEKDRGR